MLAKTATRESVLRATLPVGRLWYNTSRLTSALEEVDGSRWASPSSKRLLGQLPGRGWVRLPCTSATDSDLEISTPVLIFWRRKACGRDPRSGRFPDLLPNLLQNALKLGKRAPPSSGIAVT